jgi:hypothetical protein
MERAEIKAAVVFFRNCLKAISEETHVSFTQNKWAPN